MSLHEIAHALTRDGKGIFVADENSTSLDEVLLAQGISSDSETRRMYRELMFTTEGTEKFLSGIVLSEEALQQTSSDGNPFYELVSSKGIFVGAVFFEMEPNENFKNRVHEFRSRAVTFAYVPVSVQVENGPMHTEYKAQLRNAIACSKILQNENVVPLIAIQTDIDGPHTAGQAEDTSVETLALLSDALESSDLDLKGVVIGVSFSATGLQNPLRAEAGEVAERTLRALSASLTEKAGGVVLLSGKESPECATANLNALARLEPFLWPITFAFSHAFHTPTLSVWKGNTENTANAQAAFLSRLSLTESADAAGYSSRME